MKKTFHTLLLRLLIIGFSSLNGYAQTVFDAAKCYRIVNKVSGKSLEIKDSSSAEGAVIFQWATVTGKANQLWQIKKLADGRYSFVSKSSGKLIDAPDCTEGGIIKQYAYDGTDSQKWRFDMQTDGSYKLFNTSCQKYLRLESGSAADGASVGIKNDFGTNAFKWLIQEAACPSSNIATASIKDVFIYADNNNDTHYNQGDSPISGVTVTLTNASNQIVATANSGTNGSYSFLNLAAGSYTLTFPATLADGKKITTRNPISVTLTAGQVFTSASAGYFKPTPTLGSISGMAFNDNNNNGKYDTGDTPMGDLSIDLTNSDNGLYVASVITNSAGQYSFIDLQAGHYTIQFPFALADGKTLLQTANNIAVNLVQGQVLANKNAAYFNDLTGTGNIKGFVFLDNDGNGTFNAGDSPLPNITVELIANNSSLNTVSRATTNSSGIYSFLNVPTGAYLINQSLSSPIYGNAIFGGLGKIYLSRGQTVTTDTIRFNSLSNIQGKLGLSVGGQFGPLSGVTVELFDANNVGIRATQTNTQFVFNYEFRGLKSGTYTIKVPDTLPQGYILVTQKPIVFTLGISVTNSVEIIYRNPLAAALVQTTVLDLNIHCEPSRAQLQWVNNTGLQNDFFTLEKQNPTTGDFDKLETVNSKATETNEVYTAYDNAVTEGDNTYRIALTLLDGTVKTSALKTVNFKGLNDIRIFPNPADEFINVDLRKYEGKTVSLFIYNSVGLLVKKQTIEKVSAAPQQIDVQGFGAGSYLLRVQSEGKREVTRLFNIAK
jgi:hypothetical protein